MSTTKRAVKKYSKLFGRFIGGRGLSEGLSDGPELQREYSRRLRQMYASPDFTRHNVYPTMNVEKVYAVIAMCLVLKERGMEEDAIVGLIGGEYHKTPAIRAFCRLERHPSTP